MARIGGDEFVILSTYDGSHRPDDGSGRAHHPAHAHPGAVREPPVPHRRVGRHRARRRRTVDPKQLLLNADIALYRAKSQGRNRFEYFTPELQQRRDPDQAAVGRNPWPAWNAASSCRITSSSSAPPISRWPGSSCWRAGSIRSAGLLDPGQVPAGGRGSRRGRVDRPDDPGQGDRGLQAAGARPGSRSRKSRSTSRPGGSPSRAWRDRCHISTCPKARCRFELLETIFLDDYDDASSENLKLIRKLGIGIEIDDFGTGHASIVSLLKTGPGTLKIDRELIAPLTKTVEQRQLVGSIIEMGKSLGIKVVGEGVETMDHVRILKRLGCDIIAGLRAGAADGGRQDRRLRARGRVEAPPRIIVKAQSP
ncbi:MAG: EAL domain-containing protein [Nitrospira sp.]